MIKEIAFKGLPFTPIPKQVIYFEQRYHEKLNKFIADHHEWIKEIFEKRGFQFCYIPLMAQDLLDYHAPWLNKQQRQEHMQSITHLADFQAYDQKIRPSLLFVTRNYMSDEEGNTVFQYVEIGRSIFFSKKTIFSELPLLVSIAEKEAYDYYAEEQRKKTEFEDLLKAIRQRTQKPTEPAEDPAKGAERRIKTEEVQFSKKPPQEYGYEDDCKVQFSKKSIPSNDPMFSWLQANLPGFDERPAPRPKPTPRPTPPPPDPTTADRGFDKESTVLISEIAERINKLRTKGISIAILHDIIDKDEPVSRLRITKDFRIFLTDYNDKEVVMSLLPKAVFLLFLAHPKGIKFKHLSDYRKELRNIYTKLQPSGSRQKCDQSIDDIANPCKNSINEKCARIREAFLNVIDERLARHYYVTGKRGEVKKITLDRSLVDSEQ